MKVDIILSETWLNAEIDELSSILNQTIDDFVDEYDRIINIECKTEHGLSRFWIYTTPVNPGTNKQ